MTLGKFLIYPKSQFAHLSPSGVNSAEHCAKSGGVRCDVLVHYDWKVPEGALERCAGGIAPSLYETICQRYFVLEQFVLHPEGLKCRSAPVLRG